MNSYQEALRWQILQRRALQWQAIQQETLRRQALQRQALQWQALQWQAMQQDALRRQALQGYSFEKLAFGGALMNLVRSGGGRAMKYLGTKSKYLKPDTGLAKGLSSVGRNTFGSGDFLIGGGLNAAMTEGNWKDKAQAFALGGVAGGIGWRGATNVGKRIGGKFMSPTSGTQMRNYLLKMDIDPKKAKQLASSYSTTLKGTGQALADNKAAYSKLLGESLNRTQRLKLTLGTGKRRLGVGAVGVGTGVYLTDKMTTSSSGLLDRARYGPPEPMNTQPVPFNNNPYSN